jgi:Flp pilus assembly protein TadB
MTELHVLWLPILLSAVIIFAMSSVIHMFTPWHKGDYATIPNEDRVMDALRPFNIPPGDYMFPRPASMADMRSPEFTAKRNKGPVMIVTVLPSGSAGMGKELVLWFLFSVVVGVFAAYVAGRALGAGAEYLRVFQLVGATVFIGYSLALWPLAIWYHRSLGTTIRSTVDGLLYALLTAGTFGWLWPR